MSLKDDAWVAEQLQRQVKSGPCIVRYYGGPKDGTETRYGTLIAAETMFTEEDGQWYRHRYSAREWLQGPADFIDGVPVVKLVCETESFTPPETRDR